MRKLWQTVFILLLTVYVAGALANGTNLLINGDLETREPAFWSRLNDDGSHAIWATDEAGPNRWNTDLQSEYSFKITKAAATSDAVGWVSMNNADLYWNRANVDGANKLYNLKYYVKYTGVNTNPSSDDERIGARFIFKQGGNVIAEKFVTIDQTVAEKDWEDVEDALFVSGTPEEVHVQLEMGKDATGTVWFDNIFCNTAEGWVMGIFNDDAETPEGWMYWTASDKIGYANVVSDVSHSGNYSVLLKEEDDNDDEMVFYSAPIPAEAGKWYKISVWMKTENINSEEGMFASGVTPDHIARRLGLCFFFHKAPIQTNWDLVGGDQFVYVDQRPGKENEDWKQYTVVARAPEEAAGFSIRARFNNTCTGKVWYDDFSVEELDVKPNTIVNGDLEIREPAFWSRLNDDGSHAIWATDEAGPNRWNTDLQSEYSFKITKAAATSDAVGWVSMNNADLYWNRANVDGANKLYNLKYYVKYTGVNTNPSSDDERIGARFIFKQGGNVIAEKFVTIDQTVAEKDWEDVEDALFVSGTPEEVHVQLEMGKDATGTVWFDNIFCNTAEGWVMGIFNDDAETPEGWMYWTASDKIGYANVVSDVSHSGNYSVLLKEEDDNDDEMVFYSAPIPAEAGKWYMVSVWMKTEGINTHDNWINTYTTPDHDAQRLGLCFFFHKNPIETNWDLVGGDQFVYLDQRTGKENEDWKQYIAIAQAPEEAAGFSMRARFNNLCTGNVWYDDFSFQEVEMLTVSIEDPASPQVILANDFRLLNNYPNPFNPYTVIEYVVPRNGNMSLIIYNSLGQKVKTLAEGIRNAGTYQAVWDGTDDFGNRVVSGVYFYQLRGDNALITKRMTFIK